jgi:hypothetical protein
MKGRPEQHEASPYYFGYINRISSDDIVNVLETQAGETLSFLQSISEEKSLHRYAPGKWSIRQLWSHVNDTERLFVFRALWFARGFDSPLPSFDQEIAVKHARAGDSPWAGHVEEFRGIRAATLCFFRHLPGDAWMRSGIASDNHFTVRAFAYLAAGHVDHHAAMLRERYF